MKPLLPAAENEIFEPSEDPGPHLMPCRYRFAWMTLALLPITGCDSSADSMPKIVPVNAPRQMPSPAAETPPASDKGFRKDIFLAAYREAEKFEILRPTKPESLALEVRVLEPAVKTSREKDLLTLFKSLVDVQELCHTIRVGQDMTRDLAAKWDSALASRDKLLVGQGDRELWAKMFRKSMNDPSAIERYTEWHDASARGYVLVAATLANGKVIDVSEAYRKLGLSFEDGNYGRYVKYDTAQLLAENLEDTFRKNIGVMIHNEGVLKTDNAR